MDMTLVLSASIFIILLLGAVAFGLYYFFASNTEQAAQRLDKEAEVARQREADLSKKIKEADEELEARRKELQEIEKKLRGDLEEELNKEKEDIIGKARQEAEDVITKAQNKKEEIKQEVITEVETRIVDNTIGILNAVLSDMGKGSFDDQLISEFLTELKDVDMSRIDSSISSVDVVSARGVSDQAQSEIKNLLKEKLGRDVALNVKAEADVAGGVILQFDTMVLDGSLRKAVVGAAGDIKKKLNSVE